MNILRATGPGADRRPGFDDGMTSFVHAESTKIVLRVS
jgi:hypothetical protein